MVIEPFPQDFDGLLGKVSSALPGVHRGPGPGVLFRAGVLVGGGGGIALAFTD